MNEEIAWLIECVVIPTLTYANDQTLYYARDGDWCSNPNHAHRFKTESEAQQKRATFIGRNCEYRVAEHVWMKP